MAELEKLDVVQEKTIEEIKKWDELGVLIDSAVKIDTIGTHSLLRSLVAMLVDKEIIDIDELVTLRDEKHAELLREIREHIEPEVRRMKLQAAGVELPKMAIPKNLRKLH